MRFEALEDRQLLSVSPAGVESRINSYTTSTQWHQSIATAADGAFVVAWESSGQDSSNHGIYAQRYDALGVPQGSEFRVNTYTTSQQRNPSVSLDLDGDFIIAWDSFGQDGDGYGIYAQRYNTTGAPQGSEFRVNVYITGYQWHPSVSSDADGNFVVAWQSLGQDGSGDGIYARRYNAAGTAQGSEFRVNAYTTDNQISPSVSLDASGNFVVAWMTYNGSSAGDIYARRYNASGTSQGSEFRVNTYTNGGHLDPSVSLDADGNFVVVWSSYESQDGDSYGIYAQRYTAGGAAQGSEFRVNSYTTGGQAQPRVSLDADGNFLVAWRSSGNQDGSSYGVYAQLYNATGTPQGSEFRVNTYTTQSQSDPVVSLDEDGDFVVAWSSNGQDGSTSGVYAQRFRHTDYSPLDSAFDHDGRTDLSLGGDEERVFSMAVQPDGKILVAGSATTAAGTNRDSVIVRYNADGSLDTSFDGDGIVRMDPVNGTDSFFRRIVLQSDGKIVAVGALFQSGDYDSTVVRFNTDGSLDTGFGTGNSGKFVLSEFPAETDVARGVALDSLQRIVVVGSTNDDGDSDSDILVFRLTTTGVLDTTFSGDGIRAIDLHDNSSNIAYAVKVQRGNTPAQDKILIGGYSQSSDNDYSFVALRLLETGASDTSLSGDGVVTTDIRASQDDKVHDIALQPSANGIDPPQIILAGTSVNGSGVEQIALRRYSNTGVDDTTFGGTGTALFTYALAQGLFEIAVQADGKILVPVITTDNSHDFGVLRLTRDGAPDATFGDNGLLTTSFGPLTDSVQVAALDGQGRVLIAGHASEDSTNTQFAVARFLNSPSPIPGAISGRVFVDANHDGAYTAGEQGISGVQVKLFSSQDSVHPLWIATTDSNGQYLFANLPPDTYKLTEVGPSSFNDGSEQIGTAGGTLSAPDSITGIVLSNLAVATGYNFGELPINQPPVANSQSVPTDEDSDVGIILTGSDPNNDPLTYTIVTPPAHGTLTGTLPNVTYSPATDYFGPDSFVFKVNDGAVDSANATVSLSVAAVNDAPILAVNTGITVEEGAILVLSAAQLLATDVDNTAIELTYTLTSLPTYGTLQRNSAPLAVGGTFTQQDVHDGKIRYVHDGSETTSDGFEFAISDATTTSTIARASVDSNEIESNDGSLYPKISADGRFVVFTSWANNLIAGDSNSFGDVFIRDLVSGMTACVSVNSSGNPANDSSYSPSVSADGRFVTFTSQASNLVAGDTNGAADIFVRDLLLGTTARISVDSSGSQANNSSAEPSISADGRYVAFSSFASNLVPGDSNGGYDVFVRDLIGNTTILASVSSSGVQGNSWSQMPSISADGRFVAYSSSASNLVVGAGSNQYDIFVRDLLAGTTTLASVDSNGIRGNDGAFYPSISADGRYLAFVTAASNLVPGAGNGKYDIFVRDRTAGTTSLVSVGSNGSPSDSSSKRASISGDGRYVAFTSSAGNLVAGDTNGASDVFVRDCLSGLTTRVSVNSSGVQGNSGTEDTDMPSISADGQHVAFSSYATNLVVSDVNGTSDIFVGDAAPSSMLYGSVAVTITPVNDSPALAVNTGITVPEGKTLTLTSAHLLATDPDNIASDLTYSLTGLPAHGTLQKYFAPLTIGSSFTQQEIADGFIRYVHDGSETTTDSFAFELSDGATTIVTTRVSQDLSSGGYVSSGGSAVAISANGRFVAMAGSNSVAHGIVVRDLSTGAANFAALNFTEAPGETFDGFSISDDGRYVVFASAAGSLVAGDTNQDEDVFVTDVVSGTTSRVSVASNGSQGNNDSGKFSDMFSACISDDGRYVAFTSYASNLVAGDTNGNADVFVRDLVTGTTSRVSVSSSNAQAALGAYFPSISADGRYVAFTTGSSLTTGDTNGTNDVYVRDRVAGATVRASVKSDGGQVSGASFYPSISADGRFVVFTSDSTTLVAGDNNGNWDVFVRDLVAGTTTRASLGTVGNQANGNSAAWPDSNADDGRFVVFESVGNNLFPNDTNATSDLFLRDVLDGTTTRLSVGLNGDDLNGIFGRFSISADGRYVAFVSDASNIVSGDTNGQSDVFVHGPSHTGVVSSTVAVTITPGNDAPVLVVNTGITVLQGDPLTLTASHLLVTDVDNTAAELTYTLTSLPAHGVLQKNLAPLAVGATFTQQDILDGKVRYVHNGDIANSDNFGFQISDGSTAMETSFISVNSSNVGGNDHSYNPKMSADGRYIAFYSFADNLVPGDTNGKIDSFVRDRATGIMKRVSVASNGAQGNGESYLSSISADGRYVAIQSNADNLVPGDTNGKYDIFVHDLISGTTTRVSLGTSGMEPNDDSYRPEISADGRYVTFYSNASNLVAGDTNGQTDIFVYDRVAGATVRASVGPGGIEANDFSANSTISADGRYVAFYSFASNLAANDTNGNSDVFVRDLVLGTTTLVSLNSNGVQGNGGSYEPVLSSNGRYLAFWSTSDDLVAGDNNGSWDVFVRDLVAGTTVRASVSSAGVESNSYSRNSALSADGRYIAFSSAGDNLVPGDTNSALDVFVRDLVAGVTTRVSLDSDGVQGNSSSSEPQNPSIAISADGQIVAFSSEATNFAQSDTNNVTDIFVRGTGTITAGVAVTVVPMLEVTSLVPTATGFVAEFSRALDPSALNLYDQGGALGPADILLTGANTGIVRGSVVVDPGLRKITFIKSGGTLAPDAYSVTLKSGVNAFHSTGGLLLDGNANGAAGDDYSGNFTVSTPASNAVALSVPDFTRGYGQAVNLPASVATGIPITISTGQGISGVDFHLHYDPQLLSITAASLGAGISGASLAYNLSQPGELIVTISSSSQFSASAGPLTLINLTAQVPSAAAYAGKQILDLTKVHVYDSSANPTELPSIDDDGIHVAAYFGDANGSQTYNAPDATLAQRIIVGTNTGLSAYQLADPYLIVDITGNGAVQSNDVTLIQRAIVGTATTQIPPHPGFSPIASGGPDPVVSIPQNLVTGVGESISVPVQLLVTESTGITLSGADIAIAYDASKLALSAAEAGQLMVGFGLSVSEATPGLLKLSLSGSQALSLSYGAGGPLATLSFTVLAGAGSTSGINLLAASGLQTALYDATGNPLTLSPAPTDAADDAVDGLITILSKERLSASAQQTLVDSAFGGEDRFYADVLAEMCTTN